MIVKSIYKKECVLMITTVCLNPCIDRTVSIADFNYGGMNRALSARSDAGGKGVNVAITAATLGLETECITFLRKNGGKEIENRLIANGVKSDAIWLEGSVRTNIKLFDQSKGVITEINESGAPVSEEDFLRMTELISEHAQESDFLVLSGSLPPGCPPEYYRDLITSVEGLNCRCVLDADGPRLEAGLLAHPFMIKPNRPELEAIVGHQLTTLNDVRDAAQTYIDRGVSIVAVSMGSDGALITNGSETFYAPRMPVEVKSTVGAGDAMIAGFTAGCLADLPLEEVFRKGVACATASVMTEGTLLVDKAVYRSLLDRIEIRSI